MPSISSVVKDRLRSGKSAGKSCFPDKHSRDLNSSLEKLDCQLRYGAQVTNFSVLLSDTLARASEDPSLIDPDLLPVMFKFMDDCLGTCVQAFATGSAITTSLRRSLVLDQLYWPSQGSRERMEELSLSGNDLFDNKFDETMLLEAKRLKADEKIDLRRQSSSKSSSMPARTTRKDNRSFSGSFRRSYPAQSRRSKVTFSRSSAKSSFRSPATTNSASVSSAHSFKPHWSRGQKKQ